MSILDTFTILFNSNADKVQEGADKATQAGKKLEEQIGHTEHAHTEAAHEMAEGNSRLAESFDAVKEHGIETFERIGEHAIEAMAAIQAFFAVEKLIENFFEQAERSDQLGEKAKSLGVEVEELDAWGQAVRRVGGSAEGFEESLRTVNKNLERIALTGKSRMLPFLQEMHIGLKNTDGSLKTSFQLLSDIPAAIDKMPKSKSGAILQAIGLDPGTIRLMQAGGKEAEELVKRAKELGVVTKEDAEIAEKFNREWMDVKQIFNSIVIMADSFLLPVLDGLLSIVEDFVMFLKEHKDLVIGFFIGMGVAAVIALDAFGVLGAVLATVFSPVVLITAAIVGLIAVFALLYDDIVNFAEGNNSVIGELAKRWPIVGEAVHGLIAIFEEVKDGIVEAFQAIWAWIQRIPEGFQQWEEIFASIEARVEEFAAYLGKVFNGLPEPVKAAFRAMYEIAAGTWEIIGDVLKAGGEGLIVVVKAWGAVIMAFFKFIADLVVDPMHAFQNLGNAIMKIINDIVGAFPNLSAAFEGVGKAFDRIGGGILKLWQSITGAIGGAIDKVKGWVGASGDKTPHPAAWVADGQAGATPNPMQAGPRRAPSIFGAQSGAVFDDRATSIGAKPDDGHVALEPKPEEPDIPGAKAYMASTSSPLLAQTPGSISAGGTKNVEVNNNVTVGATTINTQASDPNAIKAAFDEHNTAQLTQAMNHLSDGVSH